MAVPRGRRTAIPIGITYLDDGAGVVFTGSGVVTGAEIRAANAEIFSRDLAARPYQYCLFDANGLTGMNVSADGVRAIAGQDISAARQMPVVVVAIYANSDLSFGLARMWESLVAQSGWTTGVFRDRAAAVAWLKKEVADRFERSIAVD